VCERAHARHYPNGARVGGFTQVIGIGLAGLFGLSTVMLVLAARRPPQPSSEDYARTAEWTDDDFRELARVANRLKMDAPDLLLVLASESGLDPSARNPYGSDHPVAVGLNQLTSVSDGVTGLTESQRWALADKSVAEQLPIVERYFRGTPWVAAGKRFTHAGQVYAANAGAYRMGVGSLGSVIFTKGDGGYEGNTGLDVNGDGLITIGDLTEHLRTKTSRGAMYLSGLARLRYATNNGALRPNLPEG
jgi:hypothetical protein